ncbi:MAG: hypothetical protein DWQ42_16770 [Planctomycetota bacterium]|nr:MAG: hypothetical protein DWQ42_16770 [Planctomycetota bacterium]REK48796.1 MAG: hypothetical protein DWQ46_01415 [Planctomycetota bacterium]
MVCLARERLVQRRSTWAAAKPAVDSIWGLVHLKTRRSGDSIWERPTEGANSAGGRRDRGLARRERAVPCAC